MILFLDTSTEFARVWLSTRVHSSKSGAENFENSTEKFFEKQLGREMSRELLRFILEALKEENLKLADLSGIAVFSGPGSFTGLRIGATVANTLADSLKIPIIGEKNSDFSKIGEENSKNDWRQTALQRLESGVNDRIALPFYGREANITQPRK